MRSTVEIVKLVRFINLMAFALLLFSSASAQPIIGIGNFKIGMSINDFLHSPEIRNKSIKENTKENTKVNTVEDLISRMEDEETVWKTDNKTQTEDHDRIFSAGVTTYKFKMSLIDGESGKQTLIAKFDKGILIELLVAEGFSLSYHYDIIKEKYGEPKVIDKSKTVVCQNGYGAKFNLRDGTTSYEWGSGRPINASIFVYVGNCEQTVFVSYTIKDVAKAKLAFEAEEKLKLAHEEKMKRQKSTSSKF